MDLHTDARLGLMLRAGDAHLPAACTEPRRRLRSYANGSELRALVVGRWADCTTGAQGGGIEFTTDGRWYVLERNGDGSYGRRPVRDFADPYAGSFTILEDMSKVAPAPRQPGLRQTTDVPSSGANMPVFVFSDEPRTMTMAGKRYAPIP